METNTQNATCETLKIGLPNIQIDSGSHYPTDREILAAKASEVMAEAIRVSVLIPNGSYFSIDYINLNSFFLWFHHQGESVHVDEICCYLDWDDASEKLDSMLAWINEVKREFKL